MFKIELRPDLTVEQYNALRRAVGWDEVEALQARAGLANTAHMVVAVNEAGELAGLTRVVSDGSYLRVMLDVIVLPECQGYGVGKRLIEKARECIREGLAPGQRAFVYMMSAKGKEAFYRKCGFDERPSDEYGAGMTQWITVE